jgi:Ni,Fe-hydrogenase I small subunit
MDILPMLPKPCRKAARNLKNTLAAGACAAYAAIPARKGKRNLTHFSYAV